MTDRVTRPAYRLAVKLMPADGDLDGFVLAVSRHRGRPIHLVTSPWSPGKPTGWWYSRHDADFVGYDPGATPYQQAGVVCHELSHMLLNHQGPAVQDGSEPAGPEETLQLAGTLAPDLDPALAARLLQRGDTFTGDIEAQAERLGTELVSELMRHRRRAALDVDPVSRRLR